MKVLRLYKILKDNNIKLADVARLLDVLPASFLKKCELIYDITINELIAIKNYLVDKCIIDDDYDFCDLLDVVDYETAVKNKK